jgi:predicted esterase
MSEEVAPLSAPEVTEHTIVVSRTARYSTLGPMHGFPRELWFVCHGFGQLASRFIRYFAPIDDGSRLIVAPEALNRYYVDPLPERRSQQAPRVGATWMTREFRDAEIADYVHYLDLLSESIRHHIAGASPRIVVLGFSQGTATVCRWLAASGLRADELVLWAGLIPPELDLSTWNEKLEGAALTLVVGDKDEHATPALLASEAERLSNAGLAFSLQRFDGGHVIDARALQTLAAGFAGH